MGLSLNILLKQLAQRLLSKRILPRVPNEIFYDDRSVFREVVNSQKD